MLEGLCICSGVCGPHLGGALAKSGGAADLPGGCEPCLRGCGFVCGALGLAWGLQV